LTLGETYTLTSLNKEHWHYTSRYGPKPSPPIIIEQGTTVGSIFPTRYQYNYLGILINPISSSIISVVQTIL